MSEDEEQDEELENTQEEEETEEPQEAKKGPNKWLWVVLGMIIVAGIAWWFMSGDSAPASKSVNDLPAMVGGC